MDKTAFCAFGALCALLFVLMIYLQARQKYALKTCYLRRAPWLPEYRVGMFANLHSTRPIPCRFDCMVDGGLLFVAAKYNINV